MQYCEGGDLAVRIKNASRAKENFDRNQILEWFVQICSAVAYCHNHRILHRDLKTNNIFLARNSVIKLGDFGIARVLTHTLEQANTVIGTPFFMSPEVCSNMPYSFKSDVWSLGCVLHELCTLEHAFKSNNLLGLVFKIMQDDTPTISQYGSDVNSLLHDLLDKDPTKRPSAQDILDYTCLSDAATNIAETYARTGTLGSDDVMLPPPSPPPTPKKRTPPTAGGEGNARHRGGSDGSGGGNSGGGNSGGESGHRNSRNSGEGKRQEEGRVVSRKQQPMKQQMNNRVDPDDELSQNVSQRRKSKHRAKDRLKVLNDEHMRASYGSNTVGGGGGGGGGSGGGGGGAAPLNVVRSTSMPNDFNSEPFRQRKMKKKRGGKQKERERIAKGQRRAHSTTRIGKTTQTSRISSVFRQPFVGSHGVTGCVTWRKGRQKCKRCKRFRGRCSLYSDE